MQAITAFIFFFWGAASRPGGPPALWLGAPLPAAAGRAMAAKLQTYWGYKVIESPLSSWMRPPFKDKGQSVIDCSPRTRVRGACTAISLPPSTQRVTPARDPEEVVNNFCIKKILNE